MDTSKFQGIQVFGRFNGKGSFEFPDETKYIGEFCNGQFHGKGTLHFNKIGMYQAEWKEGVEIQGHFTFNDGLEYQQDWAYCSGSNRSFHSEIKSEAAIPPGCYDIGNGIYDPEKREISTYEGSVLREPKAEEIEWIQSKAVKGMYH